MKRALLTLAVLAATCAPAGAAEPVTYDALGGEYVGLKPTAVGLPQIGGAGSFGAGELSTPLREYHDSGAYADDLGQVGDAARAYLNQRLAENSAPKRKVCRKRFRHVRGNLFRRVRKCRRKAPPRLTGKPAIVLDIDETSLSNYDGLSASNFSASGLVAPAVAGTGTAIDPTLALFKLAKQRNVAVFFITGRPEAVRGPTEANLRAEGYEDWDGLILKPSGPGTQEYKAGERKKLETQMGYDVIVNMGDQESDLDGGFADRGFKLPNPFYFIAD